MHHQTADEFFVGNGNIFCTAIFIVLCGKGNGVFVDLYDTGVCNGAGRASPSPAQLLAFAPGKEQAAGVWEP